MSLLVISVLHRGSVSVVVYSYAGVLLSFAYPVLFTVTGFHKAFQRDAKAGSYHALVDHSRLSSPRNICMLFSLRPCSVRHHFPPKLQSANHLQDEFRVIDSGTMISANITITVTISSSPSLKMATSYPGRRVFEAAAAEASRWRSVQAGSSLTS